MELPENLRCSKEHEWAVEKEGKVLIGITDYAQHELGDVVFVELPEVGTSLKEGEPFGVVESVKSVSDLYSPLTGVVLEINEELEGEPELVNSSPYERGWMIKLECKNMDELKNLMTAEEYQKYVSSLG